MLSVYHSLWPLEGNFTIRQFTQLCIVNVVLNTLDRLQTSNAMLYFVFRIPNAFFLHPNNFIGQKQHNF